MNAYNSATVLTEMFPERSSGAGFGKVEDRNFGGQRSK